MNRFLTICALIGVVASKTCSKDKNCKSLEFQEEDCLGTGYCKCNSKVTCDATTQTKDLDSCSTCTQNACPADACVEDTEQADWADWYMAPASYTGTDAMSCGCMPAEGKDQCAPEYEGKWPNDAEGNPCPEPEEDDGAGDGDADSSAATLLAGALVMAAAIMF